MLPDSVQRVQIDHLLNQGQPILSAQRMVWDMIDNRECWMLPEETATENTAGVGPNILILL